MIRTALRRLSLLSVAATATLTAVAPAVAHAAGTYSLLTLPDQGESAIYNFINTATKSIDVTMYELRDTTVTTDVGKKSTRRAFGWYLNGELQPWRRWAFGARYDASQLPTQPGFERAIEPYISFFPSEFLRFRLAYKNTERDRTQITPFNQNNTTARAVNEVFFQATFILGAHPAHPF